VYNEIRSTLLLLLQFPRITTLLKAAQQIFKTFSSYASCVQQEL